MIGAERRRRWRRAAWAALGCAALGALGDAAVLVEALPPPPGRSAHGAAGTARNGHGGQIAASPTMASWPGTGTGRNGGPFAFVGAQYGTPWELPSGPNNTSGVGYCVMEDVRGEGVVRRRPDPAAWSARDMARAAALMSTYGGDRVVPYGVDGEGYDASTGEWRLPELFGGGEYTRRRHVAVNFGVRMLLADVSPTGVAAGRRLARDTSVVAGSGGEFAALRNGYEVARRFAESVDRQHAVGGLRLTLEWGTSDGAPPRTPGSYPLRVRVADRTGQPVGFVPVLQVSALGFEGVRSSGAVARVDDRSDTAADGARARAAQAAGWPTWDMTRRLADDPRFSVTARDTAADVADRRGVARFVVDIVDPSWELGFHAQAPTADVELFAGSGIQGQVTWAGGPQTASVHQAHRAPPAERYVSVVKTSSDPSVSVAGTELALLDGDGDEIERVVVGAGGVVELAPIDPSRHRAPYALRELRAAPGLVPAAGDHPLPALAELSTDPAAPTVVEVRNEAIAGAITTSARDAADGDRVVDMQGESPALVDVVEYCGLVPDVEYVATGELHVVRQDGTVTPTGLRGAETFVAEAGCGEVDVRIELDARLAERAGVGDAVAAVVFQRVTVAATRHVVAEHADPDDADQTVRFTASPPPTTAVATSTSSPPTTAVSPSTSSPPTTAVGPSTSSPPTTAVATSTSAVATSTSSLPTTAAPSTTVSTVTPRTTAPGTIRPTSVPPTTVTRTTTPATTPPSRPSSATSTVPTTASRTVPTSVASAPASVSRKTRDEALPRTGSTGWRAIVIGSLLMGAGVVMLVALRARVPSR